MTVIMKLLPKDLLTTIVDFLKRWFRKPCKMCDGKGKLNIGCECGNAPDNCLWCHGALAIMNECVWCDGEGRIK